MEQIIMKNIKVCHLSKYYKPYRGGLESVVEQLAECSDYDSLVIAYSDVRCKRTETINGVKVLRSRCQFKVGSAGFSLGYIYDVFKNCSNNLLHVHLPNPLASFALLIASFFVKDPLRIVIHWHSDIVKQKKLLMIYKPLQSWLLKKCSKIIVTSQAYLDSSVCLSQYRDKCEVIPIGIDSIENSVCNALVNELKKKHQNKKIIFTLGRHIYYKGFEYLIEAVAHLNNVIVLLGGAGPDTEKYRSLVIKNNLEDKVYFTGKIPEKHLASYYAAADIFCLPSIERSEAFGVVQLEAMSLGKPIVSTSIYGSGVSWVNAHGQSGLICNPKDSLALAESIDQLLNNEHLYEKLSLGAAARFRKNFTKENMIKETNLIYQIL